MMLDRRRRVAGDQISSFNPAYRIHNNRVENEDIEFDFWSERETLYYNNSNNDNNLDDNGSEVGFQVEEKYVGDFPSPFWGRNNITEASPLLPSNHFYSKLSLTRQRKIIEDGRKELMEMIRNMPETSYEFSLKDLVDRQNSSETVKAEVVYEDKVETKKRKAKTKAKLAGSLSRTASMEADNFLLKMFFPSCFSFKKKSTAENSSRVSPSPSCDGFEKRWVKNGGLKGFSSEGII